MSGDVEFGLHLIADDATLTFIFFIGMVLLAAIAARFGAYAYMNVRAADGTAQRVLWEYLSYVGAVAAIYGFLGVLEVVSSIRTTFKGGVMLAVALLLALSVREIHYNTALSTAADRRSKEFRGRQVLELAFVCVVVVATFGVAVVGLSDVLLSVQGAGSLAVAGYGFWFGRRQTAATMVQGTMIDSLLRHLLPVMAFATLVPALDLATVAGLDPVIVLHVQIVFVIMTATAMMTATIKLRQNIASL